jgi:APA family basic amino acid/polyamine antiporter
MDCCRQSFASVHPRFKTPHVTTILTGVAVGGIAAFATVDEMVSLTNIGTLFALVLVCVGVMVLRHKDPNRPDRSRVPLGPYLLPGLGAVSMRVADPIPAGGFLLALCRLG